MLGEDAAALAQRQERAFEVEPHDALELLGRVSEQRFADVDPGRHHQSVEAAVLAACRLQLVTQGGRIEQIEHGTLGAPARTGDASRHSIGG